MVAEKDAQGANAKDNHFSEEESGMAAMVEKQRSTSWITGQTYCIDYLASKVIAELEQPFI